MEISTYDGVTHRRVGPWALEVLAAIRTPPLSIPPWERDGKGSKPSCPCCGTFAVMPVLGGFCCQACVNCDAPQKGSSRTPEVTP